MLAHRKCRIQSGIFITVLAVLFGLTPVLHGADSPNDRQPTDAKSLNSPPSRSARAVPIEDFFYSRRVSSPAWSPDGKRIVFTTNLTGRANLWMVSSEGGWPLQLTVSDDRQSGAVWSPDGKWIVYHQDFGGGEYYDLFAVASGGGTPLNLTNTPDVSETNPQFSPDGKTLALSYKLKSSPASDVAVLDWNSRAVRDLTNEKTKDHTWQLRVWSRDGRSILANRLNSGDTDASVFLIDVASGKAEELTPHKGDVVYFGTAVSPDGKSVLVMSNEKGGYLNVGIVDVASKKLRWLTDVQWEAEAGDFSPDGKLASYVINADGLQTTYLYDLASGKATSVPMPPGLTSPTGNASSFSPKGTSLLLSYQSSQRPSDFWVYDIASRKPRQLSYSAVASLTPEDLPPAQLVHYKSFDGKIISAFVWMPFNLKRDGSNPAVVIPHGGPTGQTVDSFNSLAAALSSRGYICIAPNVRGSTGYGMEFQKANHKDLGGGDLQDEVYATKFLLDTGYVDARKIGITGGSYGGFMTLMAIGKTPEVWAAAVEMYGIIDWYTMLQHEDPSLQEYEKSLLGDPVADKAVYDATSPIKYIRNEKAPLLILQGDNDIRVPKEEAEQVFDILKKEGRTVDAHFYPAEGHGFAKRENQIDSIRRTVDWFDKYLKGSGSQGSASSSK
ncbi:MAG: S9 family peptidase [Candidatus Korobacteraceae bacterium]